MRCTALEMVTTARTAKRARRGDTNAETVTSVIRHPRLSRVQPRIQESAKNPRENEEHCNTTEVTEQQKPRSEDTFPRIARSPEPPDSVWRSRGRRGGSRRGR